MDSLKRKLRSRQPKNRIQKRKVVKAKTADSEQKKVPLRTIFKKVRNGEDGLNIYMIKDANNTPVNSDDQPNIAEKNVMECTSNAATNCSHIPDFTTEDITALIDCSDLAAFINFSLDNNEVDDALALLNIHTSTSAGNNLTAKTDDAANTNGTLDRFAEESKSQNCTLTNNSTLTTQILKDEPLSACMVPMPTIRECDEYGIKMTPSQCEIRDSDENQVNMTPCLRETRFFDENGVNMSRNRTFCESDEYGPNMTRNQGSTRESERNAASMTCNQREVRVFDENVVNVSHKHRAILETDEYEASMTRSQGSIREYDENGVNVSHNHRAVRGSNEYGASITRSRESIRESEGSAVSMTHNQRSIREYGLNVSHNHPTVLEFDEYGANMTGSQGSTSESEGSALSMTRNQRSVHEYDENRVNVSHNHQAVGGECGVSRVNMAHNQCEISLDCSASTSDQKVRMIDSECTSTKSWNTTRFEMSNERYTTGFEYTKQRRLHTVPPANVLGEILRPLKLIPAYRFRAISNTMFQCHVSVKDLNACGTGKSRDHARNAAALFIMDKMIANNYFGNVIGRLQEFCVNINWPLPKYSCELAARTKIQNEYVFVYACTVKQYKEIGQGRSKKMAKLFAAYKMWHKLTGKI